MRAARPLAALSILLSLGAAAEAAGRRPFDLPAGRLGDAVVALGRQAGISIGIREPELARIRVPAVRCDMAVEEALRRMLAVTQGLGPVAFASMVRDPVARVVSDYRYMTSERHPDWRQARAR
ncbi:MAG: hypothetical protein ACK4ST_09195, partial [Elioraea tepidiphila]